MEEPDMILIMDCGKVEIQCVDKNRVFEGKSPIKNLMLKRQFAVIGLGDISAE